MGYFAADLKRIDEMNGRVPHFPRSLLMEIMATMPPLTKELLPILVLLPNHKQISATAYAMAEVSQLIGYYRLVHGTVDNADSPESQRAVLLGDLLSSAAYKKMVEVRQDKNLVEIADIMAATDEAWFMKEKLGPKAGERDYLEVLEKEYGLLYGKIAAIGADIAGLDAEKQKKYRALGMQIGLLWGGKINRYAIDFSVIQDKINANLAVLDEKEKEIVAGLVEEICSCE